MRFQEGFWSRPGMAFEVFGRFFRPKIHAKNNLKKNVQERICMVKTNTESMLALSQEKAFRAKIDEKMHVFWKANLAPIPLKAPEGGHRRLPTVARPLGLYMHQLYAQMDSLTGGDQGWDS